MIATEFSTIQTVKIGESSCGAAEQGVRDICETSGAEQHHYALILLGLLTLFLSFGAAVGRSRPAAFALIGVGIAVLVIALAIDSSSLDDKHGLDARYSDVSPETGGGYTLERIAGILAIVAGGFALLVDADGISLPSRPRRRSSSGDSGSDDPQLSLDEEEEREARRAEREAKRAPAADAPEPEPGSS